MSTETPVTSKEHLARVDDAWLNFRLAVAAIGTDAFARTTSAGWTYQSLVAHVAGWQRRAAERLATLTRTGAPDERPDIDEDEFNARVAREAEGKSPSAILAELDASWEAIRAAIAALSDEDLHAHEGWAIAVVRGNTFGHYAVHHDELFGAVPQTPRALRTVLDGQWRSFRVLAERTQMERTTSSGWKAKGMLAHVAHWMSEVPRELPMRLQGRRTPPVDFDEINLRIAGEADALEREAILERLDRGYNEVVGALAALPPDEAIHFLAVRLVAGDTYEHFREHTPELEDQTG